MKKVIFVALCALIALSILAGCGSPESSEKAKKISVVATIFPEYDWLRELSDGVEGVELTLLLDNGVDLHSYQPTADDMVKIAGCDLFVYVGGESDDWVEDALKEAVNPDMAVVNLLEVLGDSVKEEELVEGMEEEEESEEEEPEYDEHVWLSLKNAAALCGELADRLCEIDPANADSYRDNAATYLEKLQALDERYQTMTEAAEVKTVLFGDRFPFRYLADDYGLAYYAAFAGCSAETEASFDTIVFLANKVDELGLDTILRIESSDGSIAETIRDATRTKDQQILAMDSLQSSTAKSVEEGVTYLSVMEKNLDVLREALGEGV